MWRFLRSGWDLRSAASIKKHAFCKRMQTLLARPNQWILHHILCEQLEPLHRLVFGLNTYGSLGNSRFSKTIGEHLHFWDTLEPQSRQITIALFLRTALGKYINLLQCSLYKLFVRWYSSEPKLMFIGFLAINAITSGKALPNVRMLLFEPNCCRGWYRLGQWNDRLYEP